MTNNKPHLFQKGNKGRPVGAKGKFKSPSKEKLAILLDHIVSDLTLNYDSLSIHQKIRLVTMFAKSFQQEDGIIEVGKIRFDFDKED